MGNFEAIFLSSSATPCPVRADTNITSAPGSTERQSDTMPSLVV